MLICSHHAVQFPIKWALPYYNQFVTLSFMNWAKRSSLSRRPVRYCMLDTYYGVVSIVIHRQHAKHRNRFSSWWQWVKENLIGTSKRILRIGSIPVNNSSELIVTVFTLYRRYAARATIVQSQPSSLFYQIDYLSTSRSFFILTFHICHPPAFPIIMHVYSFWLFCECHGGFSFAHIHFQYLLFPVFWLFCECHGGFSFAHIHFQYLLFPVMPLLVY